MLVASALVAAALWAVVGNAVLFVLFVLFALALARVAIGVASAWRGFAWRRFGREIVSLRHLAGVPGYVGSKVPLYWRPMRGRQAPWVRTERADAAPK